jgi:hypothetical protein
MPFEFKFDSFMLTTDIENVFDSGSVDRNPLTDDAPILNDEEIPFIEWSSLPLFFVLVLSFHDRCNLAGKCIPLSITNVPLIKIKINLILVNHSIKTK